MSFDGVVGLMSDGDIMELTAGYHPHFKTRPSFGSAGEHYIVRAAHGVTPIVIPNPVGGSNTMGHQSQAAFTFKGLYILGDDTAALKTVSTKAYHGFWTGPLVLVDCVVDGLWNAATDTGPTAKWGAHHYDTPNITYRNCVFKNIELEHTDYDHVHGPQTVKISEGCTFKHAGRTARQRVSRISDGERPGPGAMWDVNSYVEDVCLGSGGGGSAWTYRGGYIDTDIHLINATVRLGCHAGLDPDVAKNITGPLVVDIEGGPQSQKTWDWQSGFGCKSFEMRGWDFEVGKVYPGVGSARRPAIMLSYIPHCIIGPGQGTQHPGAHPSLAVIKLNTMQALGLTVPSGMTGPVVGRWTLDGVDYDTYPLFYAAALLDPKVYTL
jgi:hypothetical protein